MKILKIALTSTPVLATANYEKKAGEIIYTININNKEWKEVLMLS